MPSLSEFSREFLLTFIPLFVAIDAIGALPFILSLVQRLGPRQRERTLRYALLTAFGLGVGFIVIGQFVFFALGITTSDFLVAGGLLLLALSLRDIVTGKMTDAALGEETTVGVVPIGTPLIVGPATLTSLLVLIGQYSYGMVLFTFLLNLVVVWLIFRQSHRISAFLGEGGLKAVSKIASLLLAAIAIKMIRQGLLAFLMT